LVNVAVYPGLLTALPFSANPNNTKFSIFIYRELITIHWTMLFINWKIYCSECDRLILYAAWYLLCWLLSLMFIFFHSIIVILNWLMLAQKKLVLIVFMIALWFVLILYDNLIERRVQRRKLTTIICLNIINHTHFEIIFAKEPVNLTVHQYMLSQITVCRQCGLMWPGRIDKAKKNCFIKTFKKFFEIKKS
jgi:hypothetical protein